MLGSIISGLGSVVGGLFGKFNADKQAALQREFAQSGIQWKVEDAKKAGIHPLYALGASTHSYTPQAIGDFGISEAANTIGRGVHATMNGDQKAGSKVLQELAVERAKLQNDQLRLDIMASTNNLRNQAGTAKAIPTTPVPTEGSIDAIPRMFVGGTEVKPSSNWSNAETFEKRYGELSDFIFGPAIAGADYGNHVINAIRKGQASRPRDLRKWLNDWRNEYSKSWR